MPNMSYGNCVTAFDIHFGRLQIALCRAFTFLSSFFMAESKHGTTYKLYAIHARITMSATCIFCFMVVGHVINNLYYFINLVVVMHVCVFHCNVGTRLIPT